MTRSEKVACLLGWKPEGYFHGEDDEEWEGWRDPHGRPGYASCPNFFYDGNVGVMLNWVRGHGASLTLGWQEEDHWHFEFVSSGVRYSCDSDSLAGAIAGALVKAYEAEQAEKTV